MSNMEIIDNVKVTYDPELAYEEVIDIVLAEVEAWEQSGKELSSVGLTLEGDEIVVKAVEKSPIRRIRRICGYCSNTANWGQHKLDELAQRKAHV